MPTTSTTVGRLQVDHPDLGHDAGSGLHTKIRTIYQKLADNIGARYFEITALADTASIDLDHNFKDAFTNLRIHLFSRNVGDGELTRIVKGGSPDLDNFTIAATPGNLTTQTRITNNTGGPQDLAVIIFQGFFAEKFTDLSDVDLITTPPTVNQVVKWNGTNWVPGASSLGGSTLSWNPPDGQAPIKGEENGEVVYLFESGLTNKLTAFVKVPAGHENTDQITMKIGLYSPSTSNTMLLRTTTYLIRPDTDAVGSVANSHVSTNTALANVSPSEAFREVTLDLTDGSGQINAIAVDGGTLLRIDLERVTDTDTADIRFVPSATELAF